MFLGQVALFERASGSKLNRDKRGYGWDYGTIGLVGIMVSTGRIGLRFWGFG
jgi:hypothetical protein